MVVQPLVRKHASKQDQPVRGLLFVMHPLVRVISKQFSPEKGLLLLCGAKRHGSEVDGEVNDVPHGQDDSSRLKQGRHEKRANGAGQIRGRNAGMAIERRITGENNLSAIILRVDISKRCTYPDATKLGGRSVPIMQAFQTYDAIHSARGSATFL